VHTRAQEATAASSCLGVALAARSAARRRRSARIRPTWARVGQALAAGCQQRSERELDPRGVRVESRGLYVARARHRWSYGRYADAGHVRVESPRSGAVNPERSRSTAARRWPACVREPPMDIAVSRRRRETRACSRPIEAHPARDGWCSTPRRRRPPRRRGVAPPPILHPGPQVDAGERPASATARPPGSSQARLITDTGSRQARRGGSRRLRDDSTASGRCRPAGENGETTVVLEHRAGRVRTTPTAMPHESRRTGVPPAPR